MFNLFNIPAKPQKHEEIIAQKPVSRKVSRSVKVDAMKVLDKVLDDVVNINNPRVDTLRKIYFDISSGKLNHAELVSFLKQPYNQPKKRKKSK